MEQPDPSAPQLRPKRRFLPFAIRRRERQASRRMAWRLAILLALVIGATFVYWRVEVYRALQAARSEPSLSETCGDLEEAEDLGKAEPGTVGEDADRLEQRLADCEDAGFGDAE